jgi:hypothetical protein
MVFQILLDHHVQPKVFSTGIFKISVVTDKREYWIYRKFIGDTKKLSDKIYKKIVLFVQKIMYIISVSF